MLRTVRGRCWAVRGHDGRTWPKFARRNRHARCRSPDLRIIGSGLSRVCRPGPIARRSRSLPTTLQPARRCWLRDSRGSPLRRPRFRRSQPPRRSNGASSGGTSPASTSQLVGRRSLRPSMRETQRSVCDQVVAWGHVTGNCPGALLGAKRVWKSAGTSCGHAGGPRSAARGLVISTADDTCDDRRGVVTATCPFPP